MLSIITCKIMTLSGVLLRAPLARAALRPQMHTAVTMQAPQRPAHYKLATLGAAVALLASPVCHPGVADALSWQERLQAAQERKEQALADACAAAHATCAMHIAWSSISRSTRSAVGSSARRAQLGSV
jgi:hypothetical protein